LEETGGQEVKKYNAVKEWIKDWIGFVFIYLMLFSWVVFYFCFIWYGLNK
jgi:hypothetical protein